MSVYSEFVRDIVVTQGRARRGTGVYTHFLDERLLLFDGEGEVLR